MGLRNVRTAFGVWLAVLAAACGGSTASDGGGDGGEEADGVSGDVVDGRMDDGGGADGLAESDAAPDGPLDGGPDGADDGGMPPEEGLEAEGPAEHFEFDAGLDGRFEWAITTPAAFSGEVYEVVVRRIGSGLPTSGQLGAYRLAPGGDRLGTTWVDVEGGEVVYPSICWSGEAFVAALPTREVGVRLVAFDETGTLVRSPGTVPLPASYDPAEEFPYAVVFCPEGGPILLGPEWGEGGVDRLHLLGADGSFDGSVVDVDLPDFEDANWTRLPACVVWGTELACLARDGILVFVDRDGSQRSSEVVAPRDLYPGAHTWALAATADGIAVLWSQELEEPGKVTLMYARVGGDGRIVVPPVGTGEMVAERMPWLAAAAAGLEVAVVAPYWVPPDDHSFHLRVVLVDSRGDGLGTPIVLDPLLEGTEESMRHYPQIFWEGDAFAVLWPDDTGLWYRRFRIL